MLDAVCSCLPFVDRCVLLTLFRGKFVACCVSVVVCSVLLVECYVLVCVCVFFVCVVCLSSVVRCRLFVECCLLVDVWCYCLSFYVSRVYYWLLVVGGCSL